MPEETQKGSEPETEKKPEQNAGNENTTTESGAITDIDAEKLMFMCAREEIYDVIQAVEKIKSITSKDPPYDPVLVLRNKFIQNKIEEVKEMCDKISLGSADRSMKLLMSGLAEKMVLIEDLRRANILFAAQILKLSSGVMSGVEYIHKNATQMNVAVKDMLKKTGHCGNCGQFHSPDEWCKPEHFNIMKCAGCGYESLIPKDVEMHFGDIKCGQCPTVGKWEFLPATVEFMKRDWPGYGEGKMSDAIVENKKKASEKKETKQEKPAS